MEGNHADCPRARSARRKRVPNTLPAACGRYPGVACRLTWDLSQNAGASKLVAAYLAGPINVVLRVAFVVVLALVARMLTHRVITRVTNRRRRDDTVEPAAGTWHGRSTAFHRAAQTTRLCARLDPPEHLRRGDLRHREHLHPWRPGLEPRARAHQRGSGRRRRRIRRAEPGQGLPVGNLHAGRGSVRRRRRHRRRCGHRDGGDGGPSRHPAA